MRARWLNVPLLAVAVTVAPMALADDGQADRKSSSSTKKKSKAVKPDADGVRRDPNGVTGISPMYEEVLKGDAAYAARDWDKAIEAYRAAITKDARQPVGHYRLGEAQRAADKLDEAEASWQAALRAAGEQDQPGKAKALFVLADLRERQGKSDEATAAWKAYGEYVGSRPNALGYVATATERQKVIETQKDVAAKAAKVKERIQQRELEVQKKK
jgi:tetratricopeptide (TPR) repeat protein